ncbi:uncharacterized protein LOC142663689 [Rhinoderma darwinii]|uniref:uncharacterized protein LOC142663689 n=1 Tax=Rhinoderma darwinii TaxID=43563 RepID=UPI003F66CDBB
MNKDWSYLTERILNLTQEIIYLLTREDHTLVNRTSGECLTTNSHPHGSRGWSWTESPITEPPPRLLVHERRNEQKILELANKIIHLLTGEVPIRCQDVTVYFSMEEWEYLERHKDLYMDVMMEHHRPLTSPGKRDLYKDVITEDHQPLTSPGKRDLYQDVMMEDHQPLTSPDGSSKRTPPVRCTSPLYSQGCPEENYKVSQDHQVENQINIKVDDVDLERQETQCRDNRKFKEKQIPIEMSLANKHTENALKSLLLLPQNCETNNIDLRQASLNRSPPRLHPGHRHDISREPSKCVQRRSDKSQINTSGLAERHGKIFPCPDCGKHFTKYWNLLRHKRTHKVKKTFPCSECGKSFLRYSQLTGHQRHHTGEKPYLCLDCGKCFIQKLYLTEHQRVHTRKKHFPCTECGKIFIRKSHLEEHQRIHTGEKPYPCSECGRSFTRKQHLVDHHRIHTGEKPFLCPECGKYFNHKSSLVHHRKTHAANGHRRNTLERSIIAPDYRIEENARQESLGGSPIALNVHPVFLNDPSNYVERCPDQSHMDSPGTAQPNGEIFRCSECGKSYTDNRNLLRHQRMYRGEKSLPCPKCGKYFVRKTCLNEHQRTHTGKIQFPCAECGISFTRRCHLVEHQRIHTGEKPYPCSECGRSFTRKQHLVDHQRTHTGEKPFVCPDCGKCFNHKVSLVLHRKCHVGEKSIPCP